MASKQKLFNLSFSKTVWSLATQGAHKRYCAELPLNRAAVSDADWTCAHAGRLTKVPWTYHSWPQPERHLELHPGTWIRQSCRQKTQVSSESPSFFACQAQSSRQPFPTGMSWRDLLGCKPGGAKTIQPLFLSSRAHYNSLSHSGSSLHQNHRRKQYPRFSCGCFAAWSVHITFLCIRHAEKLKSHLEMRKCISYSSLRALVIYAPRIYTGHVPIYFAVL